MSLVRKVNAISGNLTTGVFPLLIMSASWILGLSARPPRWFRASNRGSIYHDTGLYQQAHLSSIPYVTVDHRMTGAFLLPLLLSDRGEDDTSMRFVGGSSCVILTASMGRFHHDTRSPPSTGSADLSSVSLCERVSSLKDSVTEGGASFSSP